MSSMVEELADEVPGKLAMPAALRGKHVANLRMGPEDPPEKVKPHLEDLGAGVGAGRARPRPRGMAEECSDELEEAVIIATLSGKQVASLRLGPEASAEKVKLHLQELCGYPVSSQRLVHGGSLLDKDGTLGCLSRPLSLTLVLLPFDRQRALTRAARFGHEAAVRSLLDAEDQVVGCDCREMLTAKEEETGRIALHHAAAAGHELVCRVLCDSAQVGDERGRLCMAKDDGGLTALHHAATNGHEAALRSLLEAAQTMEERSKILTANTGFLARMTALHMAAAGGHETACRTLLELAETADERRRMFLAREGFHGSTALHVAARRGHESICRTLLEVAQAGEERSALLAATNQGGCTAGDVAKGACQAVLALAAAS